MPSRIAVVTTAVREMVGAVLRGVRAVPWLASVLALVGVGIFTWLTLRDMRGLASDGMAAEHVRFVRRPEERWSMMAVFFREHMRLGTWCLLPALVVALVRLRGRDLVLPVTLAGLWVALAWVGGDFLTNWENVRYDPMGMDASAGPYFVKLGLMVLLALSPAVLLLLYHGSTLMDRYLVRNFAVPFFLCTGGIAGIMITMDLLNHANDFVEVKFGVGEVLGFYVRQLPHILTTIVEPALLLATLYALGKMSRHNELISMISAGRSVVRVLMPLFVAGLWCSLVVLALNFEMAPQAQRVQEQMLKEARDMVKGKGKKKLVAEADQTSTYNVLYRNREEHRTWYIWKVSLTPREASRFTEVWLLEQNEKGEMERAIFARNARWSPESRVWRFYQAWEYGFTGGDPVVRLEHPRRVYKELIEVTDPVWSETPGIILSNRLDPEHLGVPELLSWLRTNEALPELTRARFAVARHWRLALPFRCFLMVLIAAPLGIVASRRNMLGGVSAAVGLFVLAFFLSTVVLKAGEGGYLKPVAAAWAVNGACALAGCWILYFRAAGRPMPSLNPFRWFRREAVL